jgi:oligoribonuclease
MAQENNNHNLIWIDMEMTGLDPDNDRIIEVAAVITDGQLNTIAESPVMVVFQSNEILDGINPPMENPD